LCDEPFSSLDEMTDLPRDFRERLAAETRLTTLQIDGVQISRDGTRKYRMRTADGMLIGNDAPVSEERKVVSESRETTFDHDISDVARLEQTLEDLVDRLCAGLDRQRRCGRTIGIKIRLDDFSTHTRARSRAEATNDVDVVRAVALDLLREFDPPRPVRLVGVRVAGLAGAGGPTGGREQAQAAKDEAGLPQLALPLSM